MIIGLTGTYGAGKDTVAFYLEKNNGFIHYSLSDELRKELEKRGIPAARENLIRVGTELRSSEGNAVLAGRVAANFVPGKDYVITSIRHPAEIEELRKNGDFLMVNVDAPAEIRFERIRSRGRAGDPQSIEKLLELEEIESQTSGSGQQLGECRKLADYTLLNDADNLDVLRVGIESMLFEFGAKKKKKKTNNFKIMIVDDDPDANCNIKDVLENSGFSVINYFDGESALKKIKSEKPDMVILDIMMPGMNGLEVCEKIKNDPKTSDIPVMMLTAKDTGDDVEMAMDKKADWFIAKPYDIKYLIMKVNQLVAKKGQ